MTTLLKSKNTLFVKEKVTKSQLFFYFLSIKLVIIFFLMGIEAVYKHLRLSETFFAIDWNIFGFFSSLLLATFLTKLLYQERQTLQIGRHCHLLFSKEDAHFENYLGYNGPYSSSMFKSETKFCIGICLCNIYGFI